MALKYMLDCMHYPINEARIIQKLFRHKLVHLSIPGPIVQHSDGNKYSWHYYHDHRARHLKIGIHPTLPDVKDFCICIKSLVEDIEDSIFGPNGYLERLETDEKLQMNFDEAFEEIFPKDKFKK